MKEWFTLKEVANLLGKSVPAIRYRVVKKGQYESRKEEREYGETMVISRESLLKHHPDLEGRLSGEVEVDAGQPEFVTVDSTGRIKQLADELEAAEKRVEEVKQEMRRLLQ